MAGASVTPAPRILVVVAAGLLLAALPVLMAPALWLLSPAFVGLVVVAGGADAVL